jgi:hypothetical protein
MGSSNKSILAFESNQSFSLNSSHCMLGKSTILSATGKFQAGMENTDHSWFFIQLLTKISERHISRHRQKDEEAGADGCGILNTRKRMWKDAEGRIVTKKPTLETDVPPQRSSQKDQRSLQAFPNIAPFPQHEEGPPLSPLTPHDASLSQSLDDHDSGIGSGFLSGALDSNALSSSDTFSPIDQHIWSTDLTQSEPFVPALFEDAPFDEIFQPDTASSFNNPFTTMNNYSWLFDMNLGKHDQIQHPDTQDPFSNLSFNSNVMSQPSHTFDLELNHMELDNALSTDTQYGSLPSQRSDSAHHHSPLAPLVTPPSSSEDLNSKRKDSTHSNIADIHTASRISIHPLPPSAITDIERPMSMLQPSRNLPIIDELARAQILDLIDITQPTAPDGSIVMRDHPLLSLACLQTYCDLFFTRFNTTYPLLHMSTFEPSRVDTLLLMTVLLLGATYGEKDAHQLAVCCVQSLSRQVTDTLGLRARCTTTSNICQRGFLC